METKIIEMIPANLNPKYEIRKKDENFYHVRLFYKQLDPSQKFFIEKTEIRAIRDADLKYLFPKSTEAQIHARKAIGAEEMELVHDPTKNKGGRKARITAEEAVNIERKYKESKRKATVGDIERLVSERQ